MSSLKRVNKQGFTVIEIMCVLIIISIVSSIALPAINNFHSSDRCKAEASVLVSYIRQAKYQALQDNCLNRLIFSPENDSDNGNVFKIQKYEFKNVTNPFSFDEIINGEVDDVDAYDYDGEYWVSIADTEEVEINSSVEVDTSSLSTLPTITDGSTGTTDVFRLEALDDCCCTCRLLYFNQEANQYMNSGQFVTIDLKCCGAIRCLTDTYVDLC